LRLWLALLVAAVGCAGCVTMDAAECRSAKWSDVGYRDGLAGLRPMDAFYDYECGKQGVLPDLKAYMTGWQDGKWEYDHRVLGGAQE
jgi:hypothetical protein